MKVFTHDDFKSVYVSDPAASPGRIEAILKAIRNEVEFEQAFPALRTTSSQSTPNPSYKAWKGKDYTILPRSPPGRPFRLPLPASMNPLSGLFAPRGITLQPIIIGDSAISTTWP